MRTLLCIAAVVLATTGCATMARIPCATPTINFVIDDQFDLRIQTWDNRYGGPVSGAKVTVLAPRYGNASYTDQFGWTAWLAVPSADDVKINIVWPVYVCPTSEPTWRSMDRTVHLHHYPTEERIGVDTTPSR